MCSTEGRESWPPRGGREGCTANRRLSRQARSPANRHRMPGEAFSMLDHFLESADAVQVMELMRQAELSALQLTEEIEWAADATSWSIVLLVPPARLVFRRHAGHTLDDVTPASLPPGLLEELTTRLQRHTLWRRVREELENRFS